MKKTYQKPFAKIDNSGNPLDKNNCTKYKVTNEMILREIAGDYVLIPIGKMAIKLHGMISLTESGVFLWRLLQEEHTEEELVDAILEEYEVDRDTARTDVRNFLIKLFNTGLIEQDGDKA